MSTEEPVSSWLFLKVGLVIYALLILSFVLSYIEMGRWATPIALVIAGVQTVLVAYFSMELFLSRFSVRMLAIIAPLFVILLVCIAASDIATRDPEPMLVPLPTVEGSGGPPERIRGTHGVPMLGPTEPARPAIEGTLPPP